MSESFWNRDIRDIGRDVARRVKDSSLALRGKWKPQSLADLDDQLENQISGVPTISGAKVSPESAMSFSAFFNGVQQISQTVASLFPLLHERKEDGSKERYTQIPLYNVLRRRVEGRISAFNWREASQAHALVWGNAYSKILRDERFDVVGLRLLSPMNVRVSRGPDSYPEYYLYENQQWVKYPFWQIFHLPGLGFNGLVGFAVLSLARQSIGLGLAKETFEGGFYGRGTQIGGVLQHPGKLTSEAHENLKTEMKEKFSGLGNAHKTIILEEGMEWKPTAMPLKDALFLESRTFSVQEMARWLNMPPHKLKELTHATFSNITESNIEYVQDCIRPWIVRWEQALDLCLLTEEQSGRLYFESMIEALLRGDPKAQAEVLALERQNGIINANEWRGIKNMNPQEGEQGEIYWQPLNMADAKTIQNMDKAPSVDEGKDDEENLE